LTNTENWNLATMTNKKWRRTHVFRKNKDFSGFTSGTRRVSKIKGQIWRSSKWKESNTWNDVLMIYVWICLIKCLKNSINFIKSYLPCAVYFSTKIIADFLFTCSQRLLYTLVMSVPDKWNSRHASCSLNYIFTFVLLIINNNLLEVVIAMQNYPVV
jgi:hypothetical protein